MLLLDEKTCTANGSTSFAPMIPGSLLLECKLDRAHCILGLRRSGMVACCNIAGSRQTSRWTSHEDFKQGDELPNNPPQLLMHGEPPSPTSSLQTLHLMASPSYSILYSTIQYHTIPYHTIPYHTIPYHTIPHHIIPYQATLHYSSNPWTPTPNLLKRGPRRRATARSSRRFPGRPRDRRRRSAAATSHTSASMEGGGCIIGRVGMFR